MLDEPTARKIAEASLTHPALPLAEARELREGWLFPYHASHPLVGSHGLIVNKHTGRVFHLGSAFPLERDLALYDRGYQSERYDLVVLAIHDLTETRRALSRVGLQITDITYEHGQVWRVPRAMKDLELSDRLQTLPCIFPDQGLYFRLEVLEEARTRGWFTFEPLGYRPPRSA
ncbi:MAG TPA: hypothetical protein VGI39_35015 [Polyangiaceae bacterium]